MSGCWLSVIIPAYNEEAVIAPTVTAVRAYLRSRGAAFEIIAVDDGSADGTARVARELAAGIPELRVVELPHRGKGHAVRRGMLEATGAYRLFMDADHSTDISECEKFLPWLGRGYDAVIASRKMRGAMITKRQPLLRELMGKGFTSLTNVMLTGSVTDITCGFKCFTKQAAEQVFGLQRIDGWGFDAEILYLARRCGCRVKEVPVVWRDDPSSRVRLLSDTVRSVQELVAIRLWAWRGLYRAGADGAADGPGRLGARGGGR